LWEYNSVSNDIPDLVNKITDELLASEAELKETEPNDGSLESVEDAVWMKNTETQ